MLKLTTAAGVLLLQLFIFIAFGSLLVRKDGKAHFSLSLSALAGFLLYFALFELLAFPLTILLIPLSTLSLCWMCVVVLVCITSLILNGRRWGKSIGESVTSILQKPLTYWLYLLVILSQIVFVMLYTDNSADSAYYVGTVTTSVYTNTLGRFNPYTGMMLNKFQARYLFSGYPMHNAVFSQVFSLHPLIQTKVIMSCTIILLSNILYKKIGQLLFPKKKAYAYLLAVLIGLIQVYFSSVYTASTFLLTRTYEGKAIIAGLVLPLILYLFFRILEDPQVRNNWYMLFTAAASGYVISMSALILVPAMISACILPMLAMRKIPQKGRILLRYILCMLPCVAIAVLYFLTAKKILIFPAQ